MNANTTRDVCFSSATELVTRFLSGEISPVECCEAFLLRIERENPALNAYVTVTADHALTTARESEARYRRGEPRSPIDGVPCSIKDLVFTAGVRTTAGSRVHADFVPEYDALSVARLKAAGAVILGKTNTPEFGFKSSTENDLFGTTNNPWNVARTAGGSSGGAGAATAAGLAPLSLGTDSGGSIRTPASFCGIVGFKPTQGLVPNGPGFSNGNTLVHSGPMTRTVADSALMLDAMAGHDPRDRASVASPESAFAAGLEESHPSLRVLWSPDLGYAAVEEEVAALCAAAVEALVESGHHVEPAAVSVADPEDCFNIIMRAENHLASRDLVAREHQRLDADFVDYTERGAELTAFDYLNAQAERDRFVGRIAEIFETYDLLVTPSLAVPPFPHSARPQAVNGKPISGMNWLSFTYPFNLTGNPAISVPCGWTADGLPVGLQIVGPKFEDRRVLHAAAAFESTRPWTNRRPPDSD